ncbi:MAG: hypothetical protein D6791_02380 [Chloroflexi bacterium]|nr:MAG: hypothetical protein D6791_02380 [Chloroflexota bacterium]
MPEMVFHDGLPPSDEFRQALAEAIVMANPVDDLLELAGRLREYEQRYHMTSADFYERYQAGALDDELQHCIEWAATYDMFLKIRRMVEATLMRAAIQPELSEATA